jgi:hypothetical protein
MSKRAKPHVRQNLITPLEEFSRYAVTRLNGFARHISGMSPVDGIGCLGYLRKASRDVRDASKDLVAVVDAHAERVRWMKEVKRQDRERQS